MPINLLDRLCTDAVIRDKAKKNKDRRYRSAYGQALDDQLQNEAEESTGGHSSSASPGVERIPPRSSGPSPSRKHLTIVLEVDLKDSEMVTQIDVKTETLREGTQVYSGVPFRITNIKFRYV